MNKFNIKDADIFCTVRYYRVKEKYSQTELARLTGISRNALASIELGRAIPSILIARRLAYILCVPVVKLFPFKDLDLMQQDLKEDENDKQIYCQ